MVCTDFTIDVTEPTFTVDIDESFTQFIQLTDTPSTYTGQGGKFLKVNAGATAIEFITSAAVVSWGGITGTLSNQTDLQTELDAKGDASGPGSSTNNAIPTFDGTTGKLIKDSGLTSEGDKIYQTGFPNTYIKFNNGTLEIWAGGILQESFG